MKDNTAKSLVCEACWDSIFSVEGWKAVLEAERHSDRPHSTGYCQKTTWEAMQASAAAGCTWCRFIVGNSVRHGELEVWATFDEVSEATPAGTRKMKIEYNGGGASGYSTYFMYTTPGIYANCCIDDNAAAFVAARDRITDLTTPMSYKLALECIEFCERSHTKCPKRNPEAILPDRLIDCSVPSAPRIVLTGGKLRGLYVTLSYIWGGPQPTSTTFNIDTYTTVGLPVSELPLTIRDAITTVHNLGLRYLWIDAFCILQNSDADKAIQLAQMRRIYRSAYLTIIAACGTSVHAGFIRHERPQKIPDVHIPYRCPDGSVGTVYIAREMDTDTGDASHSYYDELEPINWRGWCLQERLLSPRSLVYASDTLKYYCQTETVNIGGALCEPSTHMRLPPTVFHNSTTAGSALSRGPTEIRDERRAWLSVIFDYTCRDLTEPSDRLPALAGVVEQFAKIYDTPYLAGLWRKTLLLDLLWYNQHMGPFNPRPKWRAPSWSWACIDALIIAQNFEDKLAPGCDVVEATVVDCKVVLENAEVVFGRVLSGEINLETLVIEAWIDDKNNVTVELDGDKVSAGRASMDAPEEPGRRWVVLIMWDKGGAWVEGLIVTEANAGDGQGGNDRVAKRRVGHFENTYGSKDISWMMGATKELIVLV
ncbi:heterokaryon incompatibility protein-domain-containing protein [Geopyxis carbonaria]|nr:heterokaryon incompatibility protein-domain-containing protein [Geopyxis carbonaria]